MLMTFSFLLGTNFLTFRCKNPTSVPPSLLHALRSSADPSLPPSSLLFPFCPPSLPPMPTFMQ